MGKGTYKRTDEFRKKISKRMFGHKFPNRKSPTPFTEEHKKKISQSSKGKPHLSRRGVLLSTEHKKKMSESHKGKKRLPFTEERKEKMRQISLGNKYRFIKDRTLLKTDRNKSYDTKYKYWMLGIRRQDNWKCRLLSDECKGRLESHHIFDWINYPEMRYLLTNGITLCRFHHPRGREEEKRMIPIFLELLSVSKE